MIEETLPESGEEEAHMTAASEHRYHSYTGTTIPWYVRIMWMLFWVFAIYYTIAYLFPELQDKLLNPR